MDLVKETSSGLSIQTNHFKGKYDQVYIRFRKRGWPLISEISLRPKEFSSFCQTLRKTRSLSTLRSRRYKTLTVLFNKPPFNSGAIFYSGICINKKGRCEIRIACKSKHLTNKSEAKSIKNLGLGTYFTIESHFHDPKISLALKRSSFQKFRTACLRAQARLSK